MKKGEEWKSFHFLFIVSLIFFFFLISCLVFLALFCLFSTSLDIEKREGENISMTCPSTRSLCSGIFTLLEDKWCCECWSRVDVSVWIRCMFHVSLLFFSSLPPSLSLSSFSLFLSIVCLKRRRNTREGGERRTQRTRRQSKSIHFAWEIVVENVTWTSLLLLLLLFLFFFLTIYFANFSRWNRNVNKMGV